MTKTCASRSANNAEVQAEGRPRVALQGDASPLPSLPAETEIYILPGGQVIVADMPAELAAGLAALGSPHARPRPLSSDDSAQP